jgi:hypothetical protein
MKKSIILTLFVLQTIYLIGQNKNISIGLVGSFEYSNYNFKETIYNTNYDYQSIIEYSAGLGFQYYIHEKIFVGSGLAYFTKGYEVKYNYVMMSPNDPAVPKQSELKVSYLSIPIKIGYQFLKFGNLKFNPSIGLNIGLQMNDIETTTYEDNSERKTKFLNQDLNKMQIILNLDFGFSYDLGDKFKIGIEPFIGKGLNKMDDQSMKSSQLIFGGNVVLYYKL